MSLQRVCTGTKWLRATKSSLTRENTESWAAAWSARKRSMVAVLYRAPARPRPMRAGVLAFRARKAGPFRGCSTKYCLRMSTAVMSGRAAAGSEPWPGRVFPSGSMGW